MMSFTQKWSCRGVVLAALISALLNGPSQPVQAEDQSTPPVPVVESGQVPIGVEYDFVEPQTSLVHDTRLGYADTLFGSFCQATVSHANAGDVLFMDCGVGSNSDFDLGCSTFNPDIATGSWTRDAANHYHATFTFQKEINQNLGVGCRLQGHPDSVGQLTQVRMTIGNDDYFKVVTVTELSFGYLPLLQR